MAFLASDAFELLRHAHARDRLGHAYLIAGPEGSGKRKLVTDICQLLVGGNGKGVSHHPDAHFLEPESKSRRIRVEAVRELTRELQLRSLRGGRKVGVIFDAERLMESASNAFLKTLEEPPENSHLFLVSALPEQLPATIVSRCIKLRLRSVARRPPSPLEAELLRALGAFSESAVWDLPAILFLARRFQELLGKVKQQIQEENEAALRIEEPLYKQVGNKDGLDEREEYFKALTESRYIAERSKLLTILEEWWADALRQQACSSETACAPPPLDHAEFATITASLGKRFSAAELLKKTTALETLRANLERNVQEQLAIEVGLLKAFAGSAAD